MHFVGVNVMMRMIIQSVLLVSISRSNVVGEMPSFIRERVHGALKMRLLFSWVGGCFIVEDGGNRRE